MSVPQAAKNCWKAHCKAAERKAKAAKGSPFHRGVKHFICFWFVLALNLATGYNRSSGYYERRGAWREHAKPAEIETSEEGRSKALRAGKAAQAARGGRGNAGPRGTEASFQRSTKKKRRNKDWGSKKKEEEEGGFTGQVRESYS